MTRPGIMRYCLNTALADLGNRSWGRGAFKKAYQLLTHWGRATHICVSKLTIIRSDNGLSPGRRQAIIWTSIGILSVGTLETNFSRKLSEIHPFSFRKMHFKITSGKWRPFCLGLNLLNLKGSQAMGSSKRNAYPRWPLGSGWARINIFCVTGSLLGESTGDRWIPLTKASDAELWCLLWSVPEQTAEQTTETPVVRDAIALIMTSL